MSDELQATETPVETPAAPAAPVEAPAESAAPEVDLDTALGEVWDKAQPQPRDEHGRFKGAEKAEGDEPAPAAAETEEPALDDAEPAAPAEPAIDAPQTWSAAEREAWGNIPVAAQKLIAQREADAHALRSEYGRLHAEYRPLQETVTQHKAYLDQVSGGDVAGYVGRMLEVSQALDANPGQTIKQLAHMYGVDLGDLWDPTEPPPNRELIEMQRQNAMLQQKLEAQSRNVAAEQQAAASAQMQRVVDAYLSSRPDVLALFDNPEFEADVAAEIAAIQAREPSLDPTKQLEKAVERAMWTNESARASRLDAQRKADEAKRAEAAKAAATKAKAASRVNVNGAPKASEVADDLDAVLRAQYDKIQAA